MKPSLWVKITIILSSIQFPLTLWFFCQSSFNLQSYTYYRPITLFHQSKFYWRTSYFNHSMFFSVINRSI